MEISTWVEPTLPNANSTDASSVYHFFEICVMSHTFMRRRYVKTTIRKNNDTAHYKMEHKKATHDYKRDVAKQNEWYDDYKSRFISLHSSSKHSISPSSHSLISYHLPHFHLPSPQVGILLTGKGAQWRVSLQEIISRLGVEFLELQLEGFADVEGPHARDTVGIVAGIIGWHHGLFQISENTTAGWVMAKEKKKK